ncbi:tyrosine-protein phosphatase [Gemmata sp. JC717]|uniref:Tyrosine-protein phosphatase n=1 Tax=Gemmata algarum TaxID=2975278 RepID=A0ABU5EXV8_9BACT|nr:tyrosine-protein phosphatase [Gemmata algarum]MDY3552076.1 tyrosine-protein phosphatase [Gemmata algarum]MDY3560148.1 tyrosine-protein phosphatase [Gemmata algarum]
MIGGSRLILTALVAVAALLSGSGCDRGPRNFGVVEPGVLYRSGQLTPPAFEQLLTDHAIKTVVSLRPVRDEAEKSDAHEETICQSRGIKFVRIPPREAGAEPGGSPLEPVAREFLAVMADPANHPVYVHCTAGRDRTGTVCAVYRVDHDGWSPEQAVAEMRTFGFDPDKDAAAGAYTRYVLSYRRRAEPSR